MKNLIYKELRLVIHPMVYLLLLLSALLLIPNYPYIVGISYCLLAVQIIFSMARANKDQEFTAILPVPRNRIVASKHIDVVFIQLLQLAGAIPFALLTALVINPAGNPVGLDANFTFFGVALTCFGVFNVIFLPMYFKTGYKWGMPMMIAFAVYLVTFVAFELLIALVPALHNALDTLNPAMFGWQILVLAFGAAVYIGTLFLSYRLSVKRFDKVNL